MCIFRPMPITDSGQAHHGFRSKLDSLAGPTGMSDRHGPELLIDFAGIRSRVRPSLSPIAAAGHLGRHLSRVKSLDHQPPQAANSRPHPDSRSNDPKSPFA